MTRFPGAPPGSYVSEEGWLIVGDEAWTPREWNGVDDKAKYGNRYSTDAERHLAKLRSSRESMRRLRSQRESAA